MEIWVKEKLESIGCEVHPQVGVAGYRIDLGIKHPNYRHGYLIGVECDGAAYHSSNSARERDVIRQQILEGLGWRIYRIWSTDWFSNPVNEFEKLKNYIEEILTNEEPESPEVDNLVTEHNFMPEEEAPRDLFELADQQSSANTENVVELFDNVTYFMIKDGEKKEKRAVRIVPTQGDPDTGKISQQSAIGRALLGADIDEKIECTLPIGEVTLKILHIDKYQYDSTF